MPKDPKLVAATLARGYTRACDYLFDSDDDDAPMPQLPIATIPAKSFPPGCISPPPRMRVAFDEVPTPDAVASATRRESRIPKPPQPHAPSFFISERNRLRAYAARTDAVDVQAFVSAKPPPRGIRNVVDGLIAEQPKRPAIGIKAANRHGQPANPPPPVAAKGSMRDMVVADPTTDARPPISTGFHHVLDAARWRSVAIKEKARLPWPTWVRGVLDLRPHRAMVAGKLLRHAVVEAKRIIRMTACEHKVGMCKCLYDRFMLYQDNESSWQPWVVCLLASTTTREGSFFLEAALIYELERGHTNIAHNNNWVKSCDYGGEVPRAAGEAHEEHVVYMAVKPITSVFVPVATHRLQPPTYKPTREWLGHLQRYHRGNGMYIADAC